MNKEKVLITGGNKGIGLATTKEFLSKKYQVYVVARDFSKFDLDKERSLEKIEFDLAEIAGIPQLVKDIGEIDILINNAGIMHGIAYDEYTEEKKEKMLKVNLEAPVSLIMEFSPGMIRQGKGRIVNNASIAGEIGHPDIWYGITKAGVINFTKSFAKILGHKGIVINAVAPGPVETDMLDIIPRERKEGMKRVAYTGRYASPEEIAKTIYWLATDCPEYINGTCIDINNGVFPR
jgi:3-oxoacyl-[acyl-carrier protein] reductase